MQKLSLRKQVMAEERKYISEEALAAGADG